MFLQQELEVRHLRDRTVEVVGLLTVDAGVVEQRLERGNLIEFGLHCLGLRGAGQGELFQRVEPAVIPDNPVDHLPLEPLGVQADSVQHSLGDAIGPGKERLPEPRNIARSLDLL